VAGYGSAGFSGDSGSATLAQHNLPSWSDFDASGDLYFSDSGNGRVRKISGGVISTVAGGGTGCVQQTNSVGDGCPATSASLNYPQGIGFDTAGNLYISDSGHARIRKVAGGTMSTVAGNGNWAYSGDGGPATSAEIAFPVGLVVDQAGTFYFADGNNCRVRSVSGGVITTVAGGNTCGSGGDGGLAVNAQIGNPTGVALSGGVLLFADANDGRIRSVTGGVISTVAGGGAGCAQQTNTAGDGCPPTSAQLAWPQGIALDSSGHLYISESTRTRKISAGIISTIAGNGYASFSGDGGPASNAQLGSIKGLASDGSGNLFVADSNNGRIRVISSGGTISTIAGGGTQGTSDGIVATNATLSNPTSVAVDSAGVVYVGDSGNRLVRKVAGGLINTVTTFAGAGTYPYPSGGGLATDSLNRLYVSDGGQGQIRMIGQGAVLSIAKTHAGSFQQGQGGATFTITITNSGPVNTAGGVTVFEMLPSGLSVVSMSGSGWTCPASGTTCSRSDALAPSASFPAITVTVNVDAHATSPQTNVVSVGGGGSATATATDPVVILPALGSRGDFNGDGHLDVIWQDSVTGFAQIWFLGGTQGATVIGAANLTASNPWRLVGVGDFNQDGRTDVVWQDPQTGAAQVWFLGGTQGNAVTGASTLSNGNAWRIMSIADFNGDGHPDCIWQDPVSGQAQIWFMGGPLGVTVTGAVNLTASNTWRIVGTGDFNLDGHPDVVWQDSVSGAAQVWYLGGAQGNIVVNAVNIAGSSAWRIASVGDFNLDGRVDLMWQDPVTGSSQIWYLGGALGTSIVGAVPFSGSNPWRIAAPH
jgi:uncharacterized repeat protein (TIGR01451 family)